MPTLTNTRDYNGWERIFNPQFEQDYFKKLKEFLLDEYKSKRVFPLAKDIFHAFDITDFFNIKAVILGQDPYPNEGQAMGLAFSVPQSQPVPPSLYNIKKEILADTGKKSIIDGGDLTPWAKQGVLLLNTVLTVVKGSPNSHKGKGWESFTDAVIKGISEEKEGVVFMLWGANAGAKKALIDKDKHLVLTAAHPSPLSAHNGFFGCKHFSKVNEFLAARDEEIAW